MANERPTRPAPAETARQLEIVDEDRSTPPAPPIVGKDISGFRVPRPARLPRVELPVRPPQAAEPDDLPPLDFDYDLGD